MHNNSELAERMPAYRYRSGDITREELHQVIAILKKATSINIDVDCIKYPIRDIVGQSKGDIRMLQLKTYLERMNIIDGTALGHWSLAEGRPGHLYITSISLTKEFFNKECLKHRYDENSNQFKLF